MSRRSGGRLGEIGGYWLSERPGSPYWQRTWFDRTARQTRRVSLGIEDLEQAKLILAEWVVSHAKRDHEPTRTTPLAEVFMRYHRQHSMHLTSGETQRRGLQIFLERAGDIMVADLNKQRQREIARQLSDDGYKPWTVKRIFTSAKAAVNWAFDNEDIDRTISFIKLPDGEDSDRVLSIEELAALWDNADAAHIRMFLLLLIGTAARPSTVLDLTRFQCDVAQRTIKLLPPDKTRTTKRRPIVPMVDALVPFIVAAPAGPLVQFRGKPVASIKTTWRKMRKRAGLSADVVPKAIRHTMTTEMVARGVPDGEITRFTGHRMPDFKTTERYNHVKIDYLGKAAEAVNAVLEEVGRAATRPMSTEDFKPTYVANALQRQV